jgi:glycosyltransferase involved in cell wall biosynthesis
MTLTVVIPTLNEEQDLPETLKSVKGFATDILVVDSGSTDDTVRLAEKFGAKVISHKFTSFSETRNFADSRCQSGWILSIEADVTVSPELAQEIITAIKEDKFDAYFIGRLNKIWGKYIYHTDWSPKDDCHIWLYKKGIGEWRGDVHEEFKTNKEVGKLKNVLLHKNYETVSEYIDKINKFSDLAVKQNKSFPLWWFKYEFLKRYFYKLGFLDGYRGLFLSYLQAIYYITFSVKKYSQNK